MKKLKIITAVCIISGFTAYVNAQIISTSIDVKALFKGEIVDPSDSFIAPVSVVAAGKLTGIPEVCPGNLINSFSQLKDPSGLADNTNNEGIVLPVHKVLPPYEIETRRYISHYSIQRFNRGNEVRIRIMQNAVENKDIEDFCLAYDSGQEFRMGNIYGLENVTFPLYVKVTYRSWNAFHAIQFDVAFEFVINYPGNWNVTLFN